MQANGRGHLHVPGQSTLQIQHIPTASAHPSAAVVPNGNGLTVLVAGGLSKLDWMAGHALAAGHDPQVAVSLARETLERCSEAVPDTEAPNEPSI